MLCARMIKSFSVSITSWIAFSMCFRFIGWFLPIWWSDLLGYNVLVFCVWLLHFNLWLIEQVNYGIVRSLNTIFHLSWKYPSQFYEQMFSFFGGSVVIRLLNFLQLNCLVRLIPGRIIHGCCSSWIWDA